MTWATPEVAWPANGVVSTTDLNRIERNIAHRQRFFSCIVGGSGYSISAASPVGTIGVSVPDGWVVVLHSVVWYFGVSTNSLLVTGPDGIGGGYSSYAPLGSSGSADAEITIYRNTTGGTRLGSIQVYAVPSVAPADVNSADTIQLSYSIEAA